MNLGAESYPLLVRLPRLLTWCLKIFVYFICIQIPPRGMGPTSRFPGDVRRYLPKIHSRVFFFYTYILSLQETRGSTGSTPLGGEEGLVSLFSLGFFPTFLYKKKILHTNHCSTSHVHQGGTPTPRPPRPGIWSWSSQKNAINSLGIEKLNMGYTMDMQHIV